MSDMESLRAELEQYKAEKQKIRDIVGQIGGKDNRRRDLIINVIFLTLVICAFIFDAMRHVFCWELPNIPPLLLLETAVLFVSLKIIYMIHMQSKVDHFQFWILNSIEFQMNMMSRRLGEIEKAIAKNGSAANNGKSAGGAN